MPPAPMAPRTEYDPRRVPGVRDMGCAIIPRPAERDERESCDRRYLIAMMIMSTGLPPVFFAWCATPRPTNCASPRAHVVFAGLPSIASDICDGPSAMTT